MDSSLFYLLLTCVIGWIMAAGVGANDVSNAMGTSVGSKAISVKQAVLIAVVFEFAGAFWAGDAVTDTLKNGLFDPSAFSDPRTIIIGMIAALCAAATWLVIATTQGWPVSTTHTMIGSLLGFGLFTLGIDSIQWSMILRIVMSWVLSPLLGLLLAYSLFWSIQKCILDRKQPLIQAYRFIPYYMFAVGAMITALLVFNHLKDHAMPLYIPLLFCVCGGLSLYIIGKMMLYHMRLGMQGPERFPYEHVEKLFRLLMLLTACSMAFAHGSNDVSNAIGPVAVVVDLLARHGGSPSHSIPQWILLLGATGIVSGLLLYGYKVMATIGHGITQLTPSRGFCAEMATASTVVLASYTGLPISTTHTLVGAIVGVGLARGLAALNGRLILRIFSSWIITIPAGACLSIGFYSLLHPLLPPLS